jgi:cation:H+ antiporter
MAWYFFVGIFIGSCVVLSWLSSRLISSLVQVAKYLHWREFIIAFFVMAFAASLPNLFVDLNAALHGIPQLSFGDIIGGNLIDLTLVMAIAIFFSKSAISTKSDMVQKSAIFTAVIAVLPLLLILDGKLDRVDGIILLLAFACYVGWIFSKKERFKKTYRSKAAAPIAGFKHFLVQMVKISIFLALLLLASQAVVTSAQFFSQSLGISLSLVGILIVGLGNCFPETYFSIISARKEENWLVLGDLMGSVIVCATLVLGIIAIVAPFEIKDFSPFLIARIFLIIGSLCAFIFIKSGKKITKKEGLLLLFVYIIFLLTEIFI